MDCYLAYAARLKLKLLCESGTVELINNIIKSLSRWFFWGLFFGEFQEESAALVGAVGGGGDGGVVVVDDTFGDGEA